MIYWIGKLERPTIAGSAPPRPVERLPLLKVDQAFQRYQPYIDEIIKGMFDLYGVIRANPLAPASDDPDDNEEARTDGYIFQVSLNRVASAALDRSIPAVKADAAHSLFKVNCKNIVWAVLDSGIDAQHAAFDERESQADRVSERPSTSQGFARSSAMKRTTSRLRNSRNSRRPPASNGRGVRLPEEDCRDAKAKRPINWGVVEKLVTLKNPPQPPARMARTSRALSGPTETLPKIPTACVPTSGSTISAFSARLSTIPSSRYRSVAVHSLRE